MKAYIRPILISLFLTFVASFNAAADEVTDVINDVAAKLVKQLPMDKKIALKSLSPEETGLPEDFLRKLTSDLEAALLTASDFDINLANRVAMEDVWQEAVEFNNADFDELFKSANADVMLMMSPRAISTGVEIAITAYALTGDDVGKTLASSGSVLLSIDLQANLGVDVIDLNQQMSQVLAEIEKVGQTGGLITNPNTYAEFYHNARILQQRGEVDLAMRNYEQALAEGYLFVDPLLDLLDLANARYGEAGTKKYFEKKIRDNIPENLQKTGEIHLGLLDIEKIYSVSDITDGLIFAPALAVWLSKQSIQKIADNTNFYERKYEDDYYFMQSSRLVIHSYQTTNFQSFFIDKGRGTELVNVSSLKAALKKLNRFEFSVQKIDNHIAASQEHMFISKCETSSSENVSWANSISLKVNSTKQADVRRTTDRLGARPICSGVTYQFSTGEYWNEDGSQNVRNFNGDDGFLVSSKRIETGEANECPFVPDFDRILFAQMCGEQEYNIISQLMITDNVDTKKPIILRLGMVGAEERLLFYETDISADGTFISELPAPVSAYSGEGQFYFEQHPNKWFYAPGVLQSTIQSAQQASALYPVPAVFQIRYTDVYGNSQITKNSIIVSDSYWRNENYVLQNSYGWDGKTSYPIVTSPHALTGLVSDSLGANSRVDPGANPVLSRFNKQNKYPKPSWCPQAQTVVEQTICSSKQLSKKDLKINELYKNLKSDQRTKNLVSANIKLRNACGSSVECILKIYDETITLLSKPTQKRSLLSCGIKKPTATITNVQNYTNLRQQAGLNGQVIGQVPLSATISVVNPGSFLRYDRCATACTGTNQNAIKQCIDNNDVWIEVQYNGRRGFLSRKFLE